MELVSEGTCGLAPFILRPLGSSSIVQDRKMLRVVGIGSPHGDDQVGWRLIGELAGMDHLRVRAEVLATPLDILNDLAGVDTLVVVDACDAGLAPGGVLIRDWPWPCEERGKASSHGLGIEAVLRLAEQLGRIPSRVVLFGVQTNRLEESPDLSGALAGVLPGIEDQLQALIRELCYNHPSLNGHSASPGPARRPAECTH
jgi:hydrogenase maturation protease